MSSFTVHAVIPPLILLAMRIFPPRVVLLCWPFTWISDLDTAINFLTYWITGESVLAHRAVLHNVFILVPSTLATVFLWRGMLHDRPALRGATWRDRWDAFGTLKWGYASIVITFYLFSHLLLDAFMGGITVLWPLVNVYVDVEFVIRFNMQTGMPSVAASATTGAGTPVLSRNFAWMRSEEVAIWTMIIMAWAFYAWHRASAPPAAAAVRGPTSGPSPVIRVRRP